MMHPDSIVPALPTIPKNKDNDDVKFLYKLGKLTISFLESCFNSPSLRSDHFLNKFVTDELPLSHWISSFKGGLKPRNIGQF